MYGHITIQSGLPMPKASRVQSIEADYISELEKNVKPES